MDNKQNTHGSVGKNKTKIPFLFVGQGLLIIFLLLSQWYCLKFMGDLKNALNQSDVTLRNLFILEEKLFSETKHVNQAIATLGTLSSSNTIDQDLLAQAHKFVIAKALYDAKVKTKNGFNIKQELQIIAQYQAEHVKDLALQVDGLDRETISNLEIYNLLKALSNSALNNMSQMNDTNSIGPDMQLLKVTKLQAVKESEVIVAGAQAVESNDMEKAFDLLQPIAKNYIEIQELLPIIQTKKAINSLLTQMLENIMHGA